MGPRLRRGLIALGITGGALVGAYYLAAFAITEAAIAERFTPGSEPYRGAAWCKSCHADQYAQWQTSMHSRATTLEFQPIHLMQTRACYSCHGLETNAEGVSCEICHGPGHTAETDFGEPPLCVRCHAMEAPVVGTKTMMIYDEWFASRARGEGKSCYSCHMPETGAVSQTGRKQHFHGFPGNVGHPEVYHGQVRIAGLRLEGTSLTVVIENRVTGHYMPTGCPTKYIELAVEADDGSRHPVYSDRYTFQREMGPMMERVHKDNRLKDGETRALEFTLPEGTARVAATLSLHPSEMAAGARGKVIPLDRRELET
jgi:hypothetical protein